MTSFPRKGSFAVGIFFSSLGLFICTGSAKISQQAQAHTKSRDADSVFPSRASQAALEKVRPSVSPADLKAHEEMNPLGSLGSRVFFCETQASSSFLVFCLKPLIFQFFCVLFLKPRCRNDVFPFVGLKGELSQVR